MLSGLSKALETVAESKHSQRRRGGLDERKKRRERSAQEWNKRHRKKRPGWGKGSDASVPLAMVPRSGVSQPLAKPRF